MGMWTLSACRVVYVVEDEDFGGFRRFSFAHGTLEKHVEIGEERFTIEWNKTTNEVFYEILAFSHPQNWFFRMGYPVARYYQQSFANGSLEALKDFVQQRESFTSTDTVLTINV